MWYQIDDRNIVRDVCESWDRCERENGGDGLTRRSVLNLPLWNFVNGAQTRSFLNGILFFVRQHKRTVSLPYGCNTPEVRQRYVMKVIPDDMGALRLEHSPLVATPYDPQAARRSGDVVCAQCLRQFQADTWVEVGPPPRVWCPTQRFATCPDCRQTALRVLDAAVATDMRHA